MEYGVAAGASANAAAQQQKTGKAIGGVWNKLNQTLQGSAETPKTQTVRRAAARSKKPAAPPAPPVVYESPAGIQTGMAYADLIRRFGPPSFEVTTGPPHTKALSYAGKEGNIDIDMQDDAVIKVVPPK